MSEDEALTAERRKQKYKLVFFRRGPDERPKKTTTEMARAQTIQSAGETPAGGNSSLPCHNTCRVELPCPLHTWPGILTSTTTTSTSTTSSRTGTGAIHIHHHHHHHHHLQPMQALYLYPLSYSHPEDQGEPRNNQQLPAASPLPPGRRHVRCRGAPAASYISGEQSDSGRRAHQRASGRQQPQSNMLPRNEQPSWASPRHRAPGGDAVQELQIRRVANQLRAIGDELNATLLRRAHVGPQWQDFRDICRGLLSFITQTLSTLYRLT